MEVIPAIDIRGGRCVQLYQGDYGRETVFSDDPIEVAARWTGLGATRIHVIDLDGARIGEPVNLAAKIEKQNKVEKVRALTTADTLRLAEAQGYMAPAAPEHRPARAVEGLTEPVDLVVLAG